MNLYQHYTGDELVRNGLFGVVSDGGTLKNLLVIDADIASNDGSLLAGIFVLSARPAVVKNVHDLAKLRGLPPLERRDTEAFHTYFQAIWKELDHHE